MKALKGNRDNIVKAYLDSSFSRLHSYLVHSDFKGYEFDDLLSSPFVRVMSGRNLMLQRIAIQVGRRCPLNLRPLLGVRKLASSKAYGFFVKGYLYRRLATGTSEYDEYIHRHLQWLCDNFSKGFTGMSWGNAFDFASRGGFIPKGWPTIVWTAHIADAFDLAYTVTGNGSYRDVVLEAGKFVKESVGRINDETGVCLGYGPGSSSPIHNSNLLGAVTLLRAWRYGAPQSYADLARRSIAWSCARINADGSWYYGDSEQYHWIDNFHTAYNLDCLLAAQELAGPDIVQQELIHKTYHFWIHHFFADDGRPKYYHNREYPVDIQCAAQAIESLAKYSLRDPSALALAVKVATWTIAHMQKPNGSFALRKGRFVVNSLESIHWGQSTMLSAVACLLYHLGRIGADP